jgi:hypothetical protein
MSDRSEWSGSIFFNKAEKIVLPDQLKHPLMIVRQAPRVKGPGNSPRAISGKLQYDGFYEITKIRFLFQVSHGFSLLPIV